MTDEIIGKCSNDTHVKHIGENIDLITFRFKGCWGCWHFGETENFPYYDVKEASEILKVSPSTIRRWIHKGKLKAELFEQMRRTTSLPAPKKFFIDKKIVNKKVKSVKEVKK